MFTGVSSATKTIAFSIVGVFLGCSLNTFFSEYLVKSDPGAGTLAIFAQYLLIAVEGFVITFKFGTAKRFIPLKSYFMVLILFFTSNVLNNYGFDFNISMPLHMIFRSGSLITSMAMCVLILKRSYSFMKYLSVTLITIGVMICIVATGQEMNGLKTDGIDMDSSFFWWLIGVSILAFALFASSLLGIYQDKLYQQYGKHPNEVLFFTHLIPLPAFLLLSSNIKEHFIMAVNSPPLSLPGINISAPETLVFVLGNAITQYICIKSVYTLTAEASSLSCTLTLTLRKFFSLLISVLYFDNGFNVYHWICTLCVFIGTLLFTELLQLLFAKAPEAPQQKPIVTKARKTRKPKKKSS